MSRVDEAVSRARSRSIDWDLPRAAKTLAAAQQKREARAHRDRVLRRGAIVVAGAALVVLAFFRSAAGQPREDAPAVAAFAMNDAGYERD